jgi:hypothetical protein
MHTRYRLSVEVPCMYTTRPVVLFPIRNGNTGFNKHNARSQQYPIHYMNSYDMPAVYQRTPFPFQICSLYSCDLFRLFAFIFTGLMSCTPIGLLNHLTDIGKKKLIRVPFLVSHQTGLQIEVVVDFALLALHFVPSQRNTLGHSNAVSILNILCDCRSIEMLRGGIITTLPFVCACGTDFDRARARHTKDLEDTSLEGQGFPLLSTLRPLRFVHELGVYVGLRSVLPVAPHARPGCLSAVLSGPYALLSACF